MSTTSKQHIRELFQYMAWADGHMLAAAATVDESGYFKDHPISLGSIHKMLVHSMSAQWVWLSRWKKTPVAKMLDPKDYPTRDAVARRWPEVHAALLEFIDQQGEHSLAVPLEWKNFRNETFTLPLGQLMVYVVDHGTYHRGQINSMIKLSGGTPWGGSMYAYFLEQAKKTEGGAA